ncbi:MAG: translation elongation factor Ts [Pseudomonadota bacterium]|nr:translation elongation factor Ts [Pseudomonadota bacterium]
MAEITAGLVKELRERSGAGMMDCRKALTETGGDIEAASDWLRTKGLSKAAKKADRVAAEGLVATAVRDDGAGATAAAVEVNSETDFVARNDKFQNAARTIAEAALDVEGGVDQLGQAKVAGGETVGEHLTNLIATVGENMVARRMARFQVAQGVIAAYTHNAVAPGLGKIGVLVAIEGAGDKAQLQELGRKIALHVAATSPASLSSEDLDPAVVERERNILMEKAREEGRPENMIEKIVGGQIAKFQKEVVLLKQPLVMDPDKTVEQAVAELAKAVGSPVSVKGFVRLALGEGVEKPAEPDFASEVAAVAGA